MSFNKRFQVINPATLEVIEEFESASSDKVVKIVGSARDSSIKWAKTDLNRRLDYLKSLKGLIVQKADSIARVITQNTGKPLFEAYSSEIIPVCFLLDFYIKTIPRVIRTKPIKLPFVPWIGRSSQIKFRPYGVVCVISPWNFPFLISMSEICGALACGNCVIFKPSSITASVGKVINDLFDQTGIPQGVFSTIYGSGEVGEMIIKQKVDKVFFTGSTGTGKRILQLCAENITASVMELGGKNPMIILDDADIELAVEAAVWGGFTNSGQVCASVENIIIPQSIFDKFVDKLVCRTRQLRQADPFEPDTDIGCLTCKSQFEHVRDVVEDAKRGGAIALEGGEPNTTFKGYYYKPTVLSGVNSSMKIANEEIFGPVLIATPVKDISEAIEVANSTKFGLCAYIWSGDKKKALKVAEELQAGVIMINDCTTAYAMFETPWGGVKQSGIGRTHSIYGILEFVQPVHININLLNRRALWWYNYSPRMLDLSRKMLKHLFLKPSLLRLGVIKDLLKAMKP